MENEVNTESTESTARPAPEPISRPTHAKGHREDCSCMVCKRLQAAIAAGKPSKQEVHLAAVARREARQKAKAEELSRRQLLRREEKKRKEAVVSATLLTQVQSGIKPSLELAAKVAGVSVPTAKKIAGEDFVETSLKNAGIDNTKLAEVAAAGLDAAAQRIVTDRDGNIIDVINVPDWKSRHAFWSDLLKVKKILGGENEFGSGGGGLIVISPDAAKVLPGHPPACVCDECKLAWETKASHLRKAAIRDAEIARAQLPQDAIDVDAEEVEKVEYDDFGVVE